MRICVVGGIYGRSIEYQAKHVLTPETILVSGLRSRGLQVDAMAHQAFRPSNNYDIVHVHHLAIGALRMAASTGQSPFVFTGHSGEMLTNYEKSAVRRVAFRYVIRRSDALIALSSIEAEYLERLTKGDKVIATIPNGIPSDVFYPATMPESVHAKEKYDILYVGQLVELKGVDILLHALSRIKHKWNAELSLVYQNPALENVYRHLVDRLDISRNVKFLGITGPSELATLYRNADLLVLPSFAECLPSVVTEALLSGTPVVASRVGGIPEQLGKYGKLIQPGRIEELAEAIADVLANLSKYKAHSWEMRGYAIRHFNIQNMIDSHINLYENLIARKKLGVSKRSRMFDFAVKFGIQVKEHF